jgi:hypothetical protein
MKSNPRYPEFVAVKMSTEQARELRRAAREDDRPLSAYLRRVLAAAVKPPASAQQEDKS